MKGITTRKHNLPMFEDTKRVTRSRKSKIPKG